MRKSIGRSQAHSGALIAPFVEWHAVVARTPEEVEDGLVLMRDAIRESIREHSGTQSEEVEGWARPDEGRNQGLDYGARMHLLLLLGIESESSVVIRGNQRAQHRERGPHLLLLLRIESESALTHAVRKLAELIKRNRTAFAVQLYELVGHEGGEALTRLAWQLAAISGN